MSMNVSVCVLCACVRVCVPIMCVHFTCLCNKHQMLIWNLPTLELELGEDEYHAVENRTTSLNVGTLHNKRTCKSRL